MPKFRVGFSSERSYEATVEAENMDAAIEIAERKILLDGTRYQVSDTWDFDFANEVNPRKKKALTVVSAA